jgi:hypothetical protein
MERPDLDSVPPDKHLSPDWSGRRRLLRAALLVPIAGLAGLACAEVLQKAAHERALQGIRVVGGVYARDQGERGRPIVSVDLGAYLIDDTGKVHRKGRAKDSELALLSRFDRLRELSLEGSAVTDAGLAHLARLRSLRRLSLRETAITDAALVHLQGIPSLTLLDLRETRTTAAGIATLQARLPGTVIIRDLR